MSGQRSAVAQPLPPNRRSQHFRRAPDVTKTVEEVKVLRSAFPEDYPVYDDVVDGGGGGADDAVVPPRSRLRRVEKPLRRDPRNVDPEFHVPIEGDPEKKKNWARHQRELLASSSRQYRQAADSTTTTTTGHGERAHEHEQRQQRGFEDERRGGERGAFFGQGLSAREVLQNVSVAEVVRSNPVKEAYDELKENYDRLLGRVGQLEQLLQMQQQQMLAMERERQLAKDAVVEPPAHIGFRFNQINTMVARLGTVFMDRDAMIQQQWAAATVINTACRGFDARRRYQRGRAALARWWARAGAPFLERLKDHQDYHSELLQRQNQVVVNRSTRLLREIVKRWRRLMIHNRPENEQRLRVAASMMLMRGQQHVKVCFRAWKQCAQGKGSRRSVVANYKARLLKARAALKASGKDGVIIKEAVQKEMHRDATRRIQSRHQEYMVRYVFYCWRDVSVHKNHHFERRAARHYFRRAARRAFDGWTRFLKMVSEQGAAWQAPQRVDFRPSVNMRAVRQFRRRHLLAKVLRALRKYCHPRALVLRHMEATATAVCTRTIRAWRAQAQWSLAAKKLCLQEWRDYSRRLCAVPFQAWYLWVAQRRSKLHGQQILISAFHRRQRTHKVYQIFRLWKHLSIYGKLEGTKSRKDLIQSLEEQNKFAESLEATVEELQDELEHLTESLEQQESINHEQIAEQQILHSQLEQYKFALHSAELEIARLQALVDSLTSCYPAAVTKLREAQQAYFDQQREKKLLEGKRQIGDDAPGMEVFARKRAQDAFGTGATLSRKKLDKKEKKAKRHSEKQGTPESADKKNKKKKKHDAAATGGSGKAKRSGDSTATAGKNVVSDEDLAFLRRTKLVLQSLGMANNADDSDSGAGGDADDRAAAEAAADGAFDDDGNFKQLDSSVLKFLASGVAPGSAGAADTDGSSQSPPHLVQDDDWEMSEMTERQNWNEMLQELSLMYPMQHPLNKTAKSAIQMRIAKAKSESREHYNHHVNLFEKDEVVPD